MWCALGVYATAQILWLLWLKQCNQHGVVSGLLQNRKGDFCMLMLVVVSIKQVCKTVPSAVKSFTLATLVQDLLIITPSF